MIMYAFTSISTAMYQSLIVLITLIVFAMCFSGCEEEENPYFSNPDKWVPILADMYAYQVALEASPLDMRDSLDSVYRKQIFDIHDIDETSLNDFMITLGQNPEKSAEMYELVVTYLDELEEEPEQ